MKINKIICVSLLLAFSPLTYSDNSGPTNAEREKEANGQKCDEYSKSYQELSIELKYNEANGIESDRNAYLKREIPRVKGEMEKYCERSR